MKKITNWFRGQSKQSRIIFFIGVAGYLVLATRSIVVNFYISKIGFGAFVGRALGEFIGIAWLPIIVSFIVSYPLYLRFKSFAEKYKRYFDWFAVVLLVLVVIWIWAIFKTDTKIKIYKQNTFPIQQSWPN